jgi:hypothetical protein
LFGTLQAMMNSLKPGGRIYLAFPCEVSAKFPSRRRTLNYYDDDTHKDIPPSFDNIINTIVSNGFEIEYSTRRYRPFLLWLLGLIQEPFARWRNDILQGTWAFYGFESIIWARKNSENNCN